MSPDLLKIKVLLDAQKQRLLQQAECVQANIKKALEREYSDELSPGHEPAWYDPHKSRHREKVAMAHELLQACSRKISTLAELNSFINTFRKIHQHNFEIDDKGGTFGKKILDSGRSDSNAWQVRDLASDVNSFITSSEEIYHYICDCIQHTVAAEIEIADSLDHRVDFGKIVDQRASCDYHINKTTRYREIMTGILTKLCQAARRDEIDDAINGFFKAISCVISDVGISAGRNSRNMTEGGRARDVCNARLAALEPIRRFFELEIIRLKKSGGMQAGIDISSPENLNHTVLSFLVTRFAEKLKLEEKRLFWDMYVAESNSYDNYIFSSLRENKICWFRQCYLSDRDELDVERFGRDLKCCVFPGQSIESMIRLVQGSMEKFLQKFDETDKNCDNHKKMYFLRWKKILTPMFSEFLDQLRTAVSVVAAMLGNPMYVPQNAVEEQIVLLVSDLTDVPCSLGSLPFELAIADDRHARALYLSRLPGDLLPIIRKFMIFGNATQPSPACAETPGNPEDPEIQAKKKLA